MKELEVGDLWTVIYSVVHLMKLDEINVYVSCDDLMTYIKLHVVNTEDVLPPVVSLQQDYLSFGCCFCSSLHHRCIFPSWDFTPPTPHPPNPIYPPQETTCPGSEVWQLEACMDCSQTLGSCWSWKQPVQLCGGSYWYLQSCYVVYICLLSWAFLHFIKLFYPKWIKVNSLLNALELGLFLLAVAVNCAQPLTAGHHSLGWQMMSLLVILAWMDTLGISEQTAHNEHIYIKWCWIVTGLAKSKFICTLHHLYRLSYCPSLVDTQVLYSVLKKGV